MFFVRLCLLETGIAVNTIMDYFFIGYAVQDFALKYNFFHTVHMNILFFHGFVVYGG